LQSGFVSWPLWHIAAAIVSLLMTIVDFSIVLCHLPLNPLNRLAGISSVQFNSQLFEFL
jgi:hypothetical protein